MSAKSLSCWEITKCQGTEACPARLSAGTPCWEIARELDDYRNALNVCKDCLVYVSKQEQAVLSDADIRTILAKKGVCVLATGCPQFSAQEDGNGAKAGH
ncbi:MAG: hypothetical protein OEV91_10285 [Desulfobulbaceae bacterium]|nr:hypothetical protein [Desulfobulbaceae bacterium]